MGKSTKIGWCDSTWNYSRGCDKVSPGCLHCYITETAPFRSIGMKHGDPRVTAADATFDAPLSWVKKPWICDQCGVAHKDQAYPPGCPECGNSNYHRRRVFTLSLGDWLDPKIDRKVMARAFEIMFRCQDLDFLLCTKRPELWEDQVWAAKDDCVYGARPWLQNWLDGIAPKNVWAIVSTENQEMLDKRFLELLRIPAHVHGLSCEPLLGSLDLAKARIGNHTLLSQINWVIGGGESGSKARPCKIEWLRSIKEQCRIANVPFFMKQLGARPIMVNSGLPTPWDRKQNVSLVTIDGVPFFEVHLKHDKGADPSEWPADLRVQQWPESWPRKEEVAI